MSPPIDDPRAQLAKLQSELGSRQSIIHFAHSAVSLTVAMIFLAAAAKYYYDQFVLLTSHHIFLGVIFVSVAAILIVYSAVRAVIGRSHMKREAVRYAEMMALRTTLKLDDPASLLPR